MDDGNMDDLNLRGNKYIDFSSENNALVVSSSSSTCALENQDNGLRHEVLELVDAGKAEDFADATSQMEQLSQPLDSFELERTRKVGKCNLRKSLAWDTAFFTSAGVLEPDELVSMIEGSDKSKRQFLPGIEEDIHKSTDSISTLGSENFTLESFDVDLFEDIRASIQKSSKASIMENSIKSTSGYAKTQAIFSLEENALTPKDSVKPKAAPKKQSIHMQAPRKLNKQNSGGSQGTQPVARNGVPTSSFQKATKTIGRPNPIPSAPVGRASLSANHIKMGKDKAKGVSAVLGKIAPVPKVPGLSGSNRTVPKPALSSKSSSSSSTATKKEPQKPSSSSDSSGSTSSANVCASAANSNRRKIAFRSVNPTSSSLNVKTPSKVALKKQGESALSACVIPSKLSSSISPASSISEWSVESSSSTSSINQSSNRLRTSIGSGSSCKFLANDAPLNNIRRSNNPISDRPENKAGRPHSEKVNAASAQRGTVPRTASAKPSGLRMPSPKIGFFDGVKPAVRTPNGSSLSHSGIPSSPKVGPGISTPNGVSSKAKPPKLQATRLAKPIGNIKLDTPKPTSPLPFEKLSNASTTVLSSPMDAETPFSLSPLSWNETDEIFSKNEKATPKELSEANNISDNGLDAETISLVDVNFLENEKTGSKELFEVNDVPGNGLDTEKISLVDANFSRNEVTGLEELFEATDVPDNGLDTEKISLVDVKVEMKLEEKFSANLVNAKIATEDRDILYCEEKNMKLYEVEGDDVKLEIQSLSNNLHSLDKSKNQAGGLSLDVGAGYSEQDMQKVIANTFIPSHQDFGQKEESLRNLSEINQISLSPVKSDTKASTRTPFADKNSSSEEGYDFSAKLSTDVMEKTPLLPALECPRAENC